jgi:hypothetical protein
VLLALESVILALPVTALALYVAFAMLAAPGSGTSSIWVALLAIVVAALAAGWRLIGAFVWGGIRALRSVSPVWLVVAGLGPVLVAAAVFASLTDVRQGAVWKTELEIMIFGSPAAVPYAHLLLEWFLRKDHFVAAAG